MRRRFGCPSNFTPYMSKTSRSNQLKALNTGVDVATGMLSSVRTIRFVTDDDVDAQANQGFRDFVGDVEQRRQIAVEQDAIQRGVSESPKNWAGHGARSVDQGGCRTETRNAVMPGPIRQNQHVRPHSLEPAMHP